MKLALFNEYALGVVKGDAIVDVTAVVADLPRSTPAHLMTVLVGSFERYRDRIEAAAKGSGTPLTEVRLRPPLPSPPNIVCMAANYNDGIMPPRPNSINAFHKATSAVIGPGDTMELPDVPASIFEGEAELAVVIGKQASNVPETEAMNYVFGYTNFIDGSARDLPIWLQMKSRATFAPLGPYLVTADEIPDPHRLQVRSWTNGILMQDYSTSDMANSIPRCISWLSGVHVLEPGAVVAMGTHHAGLNAFQDGDVVELETEGLGRLRIAVRDDLKRTWGRETRGQLRDRLPPGATTPQLAGKYAKNAA